MTTEKTLKRSHQRAEVSAVLKRGQVGKYLGPRDTALILEMAKQVSRYSKAADHPSARVIVRQHYRFRVKTLYLITDSHNIPMLIDQLSTAGIDPGRVSKPTSRSMVMRTCREIISEQILDWATQFWESTKTMKPGPRCPVSGKSLRANKCAVDHVYPFVKLVEEWAAQQGLEVDQIVTKQSRKLGRRTMGPELDESWSLYHLTQAKLAMLTAKANMQKGARIADDSPTADILS